MIAFDFEYYKPSSVAEALETYKTISKRTTDIRFYSGGTEFITFARLNKLSSDAVIDLKGIADCNVLERQGDQLIIGSAVSLNTITNSNLFPLLGQTVKQIADHTSRNKITIGGNMNSQLMYRESILPLLITDAHVKITKNKGVEIVPLKAIFNKELALNPGNFLIQIIVDAEYVDLPFVSLKKTKFSKIGYPLVSVAAVAKENRIRAAFSGVCDYPFRSAKVERILNDSSLQVSERIEQVIARLPSPIVDDIEGSAAYREFVLKNILVDTMKVLEMAK